MKAVVDINLIAAEYCLKHGNIGGCRYHLAKAMGECNRLGNRKLARYIMQALSFARRIEA